MDENATLKSTRRTRKDKKWGWLRLRIAKINYLWELAPELSKRLWRKCATASLSDILSLLNLELPLCILIGFAKHLNELQVNQIGSIGEGGTWSTLMFIENLYNCIYGTPFHGKAKYIVNQLTWPYHVASRPHKEIIMTYFPSAYITG